MQIFERMNAKLKENIKTFAVVLIVIYWIGGLVLYSMQEKILFHPKPLSPNHRFQFEQKFEELNIPLEKNKVSIVKFRPDTPRKGIVLFYHGNMENVEHYRSYPSFFLRNNYEIWMIDYPGFGKTTGKRTEKIMKKEAILMYDMASKETGNIIIYGKSIGTGVASYVASNRNCSQLILETPYYSIPSLAKHYLPVYPVKLLLNYSFPICDYLKKVKSPVTIFHGTKDEIVPYKHSLWLKQENKNVELITLKNGQHNNLPGFDLFQRKIDSLLIK